MRLCTILFMITFFVCCNGKVYTKCGLLEDLTRRGFNKQSFVRQWVCLVESESFKDTSKIVKKADRSTSYGLFQINSKEWCTEGKPGGKCNVKCEDLATDDITLASQCAMMIFQQRGFKAWDGWKRACEGRTAVFQYRC